MQVFRSAAYRVNARTVLFRGDRFKASGGPFYRHPDGSTTRMSAKGPFKFHAHVESKGVQWIEAYSERDGGFCVLCLTDHPSVLPDRIVTRPYRISGMRKSKVESHPRTKARRTTWFRKTTSTSGTRTVSNDTKGPPHDGG